jgi:hypothetical protein
MPGRSKSHFFLSTQSVSARLGDSHSFISASYAGLRELWWQVRGFGGQFPALNPSQIQAKFLTGLPTPGGIDIRRMFLTADWSRHEQEFSKWCVFEACTLYEGWAEKTCSEIFARRRAEKHAKNIQFPSGVDDRGNLTGYMLAINEASDNSSLLMKTEFFPRLSTHPLNRWSTIEDQLVAYRFFKECRNSIIHSGGLVTDELLVVLEKLQESQAKDPSPFNHQFKLPPMTLGQPIVIDMRDSVLFSTVVRFLICTFDAALCVASACESILEERIRHVIEKDGQRRIWPVDAAKRIKRVRGILGSARVPDPNSFKNVERWMCSKGLIN